LQQPLSWLEPRLVVAGALFLVACGLESRRLAGAVARPVPALWAVLISYGLLPALAWLCGKLLPGEDLRLGLLIASSVPCTLASAVLWTRMAGGNEATTLLVVVLTTGMSWLATTGWLMTATGTRVRVDTSEMMASLALVLLLPLLLGQLCRVSASFRAWALGRRVQLGVLARLLILSIILKAAVDVRGKLGGAGPTLSAMALTLAALAALGTHLSALFVGLASARALRFGRADGIAIAFGCSQKTLPVALFLFDRYYRETHPFAVVSLVCYHVGQLVVDTVIADRMARWSPAGPDEAAGR
jgi:sodium/bile acid cotransporter 7